MDILLERILSLVPDQHGGDKEFALSIGYKSGNVIADWRAGRSKSYKGKVREISRVYGVSVDWLCGNDGKKEKHSTNGEVLSKAKLDLIEKIKRMDDAMVKSLNDLADQVLALQDK